MHGSKFWLFKQDEKTLLFLKLVYLYSKLKNVIARNSNDVHDKLFLYDFGS